MRDGGLRRGKFLNLVWSNRGFLEGDGDGASQEVQGKEFVKVT